MPAKKRVKNNRSLSTPQSEKSYTFFEDVYAVVRLVPIGRVTTYGAIAAFLGTRLSARMVGWAMNASHSVIPNVPAHRVVNRNGMLSGKNHFSTSTEMEELLREEGIEIEREYVVNFAAKFWDPGKEIGIEA
jgi:methylated-DNA-protein-cysteine methyltransferase-like protein